ncbi:hypothetical protein ACOSP7_016203 [Xanthoceras sorbifolium]
MVKLKVNQPVEVDFNLYGQTIDGSSITLASYIGILAREHQKKDMMWSSLLITFLNKWGADGDNTSLVSRKSLEASQGPGKKRAFKSKNFRAIQLSQKTQHTTGRRGYTRLHHIMRKEKIQKRLQGSRVDVWIEGHKRKKNMPLGEAVQIAMSTCPPNDNNIKEDSLTKVLGAEKRGRVRGLGFGATPSRVQTQIQSGGRVKQLEVELEATNDQEASLKEMINMIVKQNE